MHRKTNTIGVRRKRRFKSVGFRRLEKSVSIFRMQRLARLKPRHKRQLRRLLSGRQAEPRLLPALQDILPAVYSIYEKRSKIN